MDNTVDNFAKALESFLGMDKQEGGTMSSPPKEGGLNASNYNNPYQNPDADGGGLRAWTTPEGGYGGQMMPKQSGWMGEIEGLTGDKITEFSSGGEDGEPFFPTVFEGMTPEQINTLKEVEAGNIDFNDPRARELNNAAREAADKRIKQGLSPFKDLEDFTSKK